MTRSSTSPLASAGFCLAVVMAALVLTPRVATAEGPSACSGSCKAAYGACYKKSQDRSRCQAQLQRCLESCIRSRR
ncbi:MAG TPA: hypothetical protein VJ740_01180 [Hyphomicrobiaceae bacterium]|nr:hypothetical protein [Hyphomicrobiaceae bacterium]